MSSETTATSAEPHAEPGMCFEDFVVGRIYRHRFGRTLTETDNSWFCLLTLGMNQVHFNADYARHTPYGKPIIPSPLTLAVVTGLSTLDFGQNTMANLGWDKVALPHPVINGDTIYARSKVTAVRASKKRPNVGIVELKSEGYNQDGNVVITFDRKIMVYRRGHAPGSHSPTVKSSSFGTE